MVYRRHHAIIVTGDNEGLVDEAEEVADEIFGVDHVNIKEESEYNGFWTFMILPDGGYENCQESIEGDCNRDEFIKWLEEQKFGDGSSSFNWVEVQYGDDFGETKIVRDSDAYRRKKIPYIKANELVFVEKKNNCNTCGGSGYDRNQGMTGESGGRCLDCGGAGQVVTYEKKRRVEVDPEFKKKVKEEKKFNTVHEEIVSDLMKD